MCCFAGLRKVLPMDGFALRRCLATVFGLTTALEVLLRMQSLSRVSTTSESCTIFSEKLLHFYGYAIPAEWSWACLCSRFALLMRLADLHASCASPAGRQGLVLVLACLIAGTVSKRALARAARPPKPLSLSTDEDPPASQRRHPADAHQPVLAPIQWQRVKWLRKQW